MHCVLPSCRSSTAIKRNELFLLISEQTVDFDGFTNRFFRRIERNHANTDKTLKKLIQKQGRDRKNVKPDSETKMGRMLDDLA